MTKNYLVPEGVGRIAQAAGVEHVVLTHLVPSPEVAADPNVYAQGVQSAYKAR